MGRAQWRSDRDFTEAVKEWNLEMNEVQRLAKRTDVYFVKYEEFYESKAAIERMFDYLEVDSQDPAVQRAIRHVLMRREELRGKNTGLTENEQAYVQQNADLRAYNVVEALYRRQQKKLWAE